MAYYDCDEDFQHLREIIRTVNNSGLTDTLQSSIISIIERSYFSLQGWLFEDDSSLMYWACHNGFYAIVKVLLKNGFNVNWCGSYRTMDIACEEYLKNRYGKDDNCVSIRETIEVLVTYGANDIAEYKKEDNYLSQEIPLLYGIVSGDLEKISKYLAKRSNVDDFRYAFDKTALMCACKNRKFEVALTLISAGADINAKDRNGKTVLNYAAEGRNVEIMKLLLAQGADNGVKK